MALLRNKMYLFRGKKERMSRERETEKAMKPPRTKFPNFEKGKSFLFFPFSPAGRKKDEKNLDGEIGEKCVRKQDSWFN